MVNGNRRHREFLSNLQQISGRVLRLKIWIPSNICVQPSSSFSSIFLFPWVWGGDGHRADETKTIVCTWEKKITPSDENRRVSPRKLSPNHKGKCVGEERVLSVTRKERIRATLLPKNYSCCYWCLGIRRHPNSYDYYYYYNNHCCFTTGTTPTILALIVTTITKSVGWCEGRNYFT